MLSAVSQNCATLAWESALAFDIWTNASQFSSIPMIIHNLGLTDLRKYPFIRVKCDGLKFKRRIFIELQKIKLSKLFIKFDHGAKRFPFRALIPQTADSGFVIAT